MLGGRAHSTGELREKLRGKAESAADVDPTIARLKEYGYLNDRKFAENFAAARLENEGLGKTRVLADLSRRRVAPAVAQQTVGKVYEDIDEQALAEEFVRRKFRMASKESLFQDDEADGIRISQARAGWVSIGDRRRGAQEVRAQSGSAGWVRAAGRNGGGIAALCAAGLGVGGWGLGLCPPTRYSGFRAKRYSATGCPAIRCSWMIRSRTSGVTE